MKPQDLIEPFARADGPPPRTLLPFMHWCLRGTLPVLSVSAVLSATVGLLEVISALLLGRIIDSALESSPDTVFSDHAWLFAGTVLFFVCLRPVFFFVAAAANTIVVQPNVMPLVLSRLHRWTLGQSVGFFDADFAGRIAQKQMQTARAVTDTVSETINVVFFALASLIGSALLLTAIDWRIALTLTLWLAAYFLLITYTLPRVRDLSKARAGARAMVSGQVVDTITNIKTVKLFAHAGREDQAALDAMGDYREKFIAFGRMATIFRTSLIVLAGFLPVLLIGGSLLLWSRGIATPGDIAASGAISFRISQMTGWVSFALMTIYSHIGEAEDGMRTLTPPHDLTDAEGASVLPSSNGEVAFDNVSFSYGRGEGGISGVSLRLEPGEKVGLVGASGAGKSTLVALLLRLHDAESGAVLVDGHDVRSITQDSLRRQIGMVTQETSMFNRSAKDNLLYGRPDASNGEMVEAARRAEAHDFILELKDQAGREGYNAHLGERGVRLSGGQRQRIALARAILKDAPILVLDEATSALDSEVEAQIQAALERVMDGKTVLAIAHRLSTIARMDRIVVMDRGQIVEEGRHADLLARGGLYARYWQRQSGGFLNLDEAAE